MSFLDDIIEGITETSFEGFFNEPPLSSPRTDKVREKEMREAEAKALKGDRNALLFLQADQTTSDSEREAINAKLNSLDPSDKLAAELFYAATREKESQRYINAAKSELAIAKKRYEEGVTDGTEERELEREYMDALDMETGGYTTIRHIGDVIGPAKLVSKASEAYDYRHLTGDSPAAMILHFVFKGEGRAAIRDYLKQLSPEQRALAMKEVARVAADNSYYDIGHAERLDASEKILNNDYTNEDRVIDDAESVLELLFGLETDFLTKAAVGITKPVARRFAGFAREAAKNKGFLKFLVSNESERMAKEGSEKLSEVGKKKMPWDEIEQELKDKGSTGTLLEQELNSEKAAFKAYKAKNPNVPEEDLVENYLNSSRFTSKGEVTLGDTYKKNKDVIDTAVEYFDWKNGSVMSPVDNGVIKGIVEGSNLSLKDSFLKSALAVDRYTSNRIASDTFKVRIKLPNEELIELDSPTMKALRELSVSGKEFNVENISKVVDNDAELAKKIYDKMTSGSKTFLYKKGDNYYAARGEVVKVQEQVADYFIGVTAPPKYDLDKIINSPLANIISNGMIEKAKVVGIFESAIDSLKLPSRTRDELVNIISGNKRIAFSVEEIKKILDVFKAKKPKIFKNADFKQFSDLIEKYNKTRLASEFDSSRRIYTSKLAEKAHESIFNPKKIDTIEIKDELLNNVKEKQLINYFDRKAEVLSRKLDGDWSKYFDRQNNNKPFNVIAQMNTSVDNSGVARAQAFKEALEGEEYTSQGLDTAETLFADTMPSVGDNIAPMDRAEAFKQALQDSMVELASDAERESIAKDLAEQLGKLNGSNIDISVSGTESVVKCTFSGKGNSGYNSIQEARNALKELTDNLSNMGVREPEFKVVGADSKGALEAVQEGVDYDKYYLQLEHRNDISYLFTGTGEMVDKAASIWDSTTLTRWIRDNVAKASTILPEQLLRPLMASFERREGFMASNFLKEATDFKKAFNKLDRKERANVFTLIYEQNLKALEASKKGEVFEGFTVVDLKGRGFSDEEITAISKLKDVQDLSWHMKNLANARALSSLGYQAVPTASRGRMIGKEVDKWEIAKSAEKGMLSVFDSATGEVVEMSGRSLKGYKVFKFPTAYNGTTEYFITPLSTKAGAINWRFDQTIGRIPGYCEMRMKQGLIYIEENGKTVGVTDSVKKAEDYIGGRTDTFSWRLDRNVKEEKAGMSESTMDRRYGVELVNVDINDVFLNPLESMDAGIKAASSRTHVGPVIQHAKKDFVKIYGDVLSKGKYPESITEIRGNSEQANAARSMYNYIEKMSGVAEGLEIDSTYKAVLYRYGEKLGKIAYDNGGALGWIAEQGERALFSAARTDLLAWSRKVVSTAYIALNPIRQFFLQGVQLGNAYAVDPKSAHKLLMQVSSVFLSKTKLSHLPEEYQHFADLCERAGILTSQSSVGFISDAIDFAASMNNPVGKLFEYSAKGAMFGEKLQQMFHAAALYNKRVREFGKEWFNVRKNFDSFIEEVRIMSGSQSPVERMPWENGVLGAVFQFAQSPWKMNQLLFNKQLPKSMRAAILTNELLLFGAGTYGASLIYDNLLGEKFGQNLDEETREVIKDGLFGFSVNKLFGIKMDTENFAPTNYWDVVGFFGRAFGYNETEMATWMAGKWTKEEAENHEKRLQLDDSTVAEKAIGLASVPTATFIKSRVAPIFRDIMSITGRGNPYDPKDIGDLVLDIGRMSSGFNQATKAYIAYTTGNYLNSKGAVLKEGLDGWAALGLLMGLNPEITKEERSKAFMETAWRDSEKISVTTAYKSCLEYLNKTYGRVNNLGADENFKRDLEILKRLSVTWVNGDPERQLELDTYMSKELTKAAKGQKSDAYVIGKWLTTNLKQNHTKFIAAYDRLKKNDPERARMVEEALTKLAREKINREE